MTDTQVKSKRNGNIELLRIIAMAMVVILHGLDKGKNLPNPAEESTINVFLAWLFESLSVVAVNVFILISGYFLVKGKFKIGRLLEIICQVLFYTVIVSCVFSLFGIGPFGELELFDYFNMIFPLHNHVYWFVSMYVLLYLFTPVINKAVNALGRKQLGVVLVLLVIYETLLKTVLPIRYNGDGQGYDFLWFLTVYLIGAYLSLYGFKHIITVRNGLILYFAGVILIFCENLCLNFLGYYKNILTSSAWVGLDYNHLINIYASIGLFGAFIAMKPMKEGVNGFICRLSPMALGIYLFHEIPSMRFYWPGKLGIYELINKSTPAFVFRFLGTVLLMIAIGLLIDFVRIKLFEGVKKACRNTGLVAGMKKLDGWVNGDE